MANRRNAATAEEPEMTTKEEEGTPGVSEDGGVQSGGEAGEDKKPAAGGEKDEAVIKMVYIGPSIPFGKLRTSMILQGTAEELKAFLADQVEKYPEIPYLLVSPEELAGAQEMVEKKGTILHKYYGDMLAKSRARRVGQG